MSQKSLRHFQWGLAFSSIYLSLGISLHIGMRLQQVQPGPLPFHMRFRAIPIPLTFSRFHRREGPFRC
jgi:hypothetical protein